MDDSSRITGTEQAMKCCKEIQSKYHPKKERKEKKSEDSDTGNHTFETNIKHSKPAILSNFQFGIKL